MSDAGHDWPLNYFNYFTEVEEHFQKVRGTGLFLLSPLDWALIESWKNAGVPLEAVLRGVDAAFEKWRSGRPKTRLVNSLAYCAQAVLEQAQIMAGAGPPAAPRQSAPPFELNDLRDFLGMNVLDLRAHAVPAFDEVATALEGIIGNLESHYRDLEQLEQRLTALEEKMIAVARCRQTEAELFEARRQLDLELRPYRGKMTPEQLAMLERQYLDRRVMERAGLPRLSLFYLR